MIETRVTKMFGLDHPIMQGGMQRVSTAELVAAVASAGALGFLSALTQPSPESLRKEIERTRSLTQRDFGVNLTILPSQNPPDYEAYAQVICESGIKVVETAGRNPEFLMPMFRRHGVRVVHKCTAVKHALKAEQIGCDAVIIDGFEAAGHPGENDTPSLVLLPRAIASLTVPVIACGGFANGHGLAAALSLGAEAVSMGTRFMASRESPIHQSLKDTLIAATELDTQLILRKFRNTARVYRNEVAIEVARRETEIGCTFEDVSPLVSGSKGGEVLETGDLSRGIFWAGISCGLISDTPPVAEIVERISSEAQERIQSLARRIHVSK